MGIIRKIVYATLVTKNVREAVKIDELKKLNEALARPGGQGKVPKSRFRRG